MHVIGTAGHVDHGKSALVHALTGIDPDRFAEEKRRGMTIDLGFAWMQLPSGVEIGIIDVPGHERFIRNMLAGAGGISVCMFVVAANEGWRPQSAEHLAILDVLDIKYGVVALTKADTVDAPTLDAVAEQVKERLSRTSLSNAPIVACSAATHTGLDQLVAALDTAVHAAPPSLDRHHPRMWIDRAFTIAGSGTVVTGTVVGGAFHQGSAVELAPHGESARIRGIQTHRRTTDSAAPGTRAALNLAGLDRSRVQRGNLITKAGTWRPTRLVDAEVRLVVGAGVPDEMTEKGSYLLYVGSAETPVAFRLLGVDRVGRDDNVFAQVRLRDPLPLERGDRFVVRDAGRVLTLAGGTILDPGPSSTRRNDHKRIETLRRLARAGPRDALVALVDHYEELDIADALFRSGAAGDDLASVTTLADIAVSEARLNALIRATQDATQNHHAGHPLDRGISREELRSIAGLAPEPFAALLAASPGLVADAEYVRTSTHRVKLDPAQEDERQRVIEILEGAGFTPPLTSELNVDPRLLRALESSNDLVRIGNFHLTGDRAREAQHRVAAAIQERGPLTVAEIRDLLATTRKYAVPLCEWLDATGTTIRKGDTRVLGPRA